MSIKTFKDQLKMQSYCSWRGAERPNLITQSVAISPKSPPDRG